MTQIEALRLQQENLSLKIEVLTLRSRVNELAIDTIKRARMELAKAEEKLTQVGEGSPDEVQAIKAGLTD